MHRRIAVLSVVIGCCLAGQPTLGYAESPIERFERWFPLSEGSPIALDLAQDDSRPSRAGESVYFLLRVRNLTNRSVRLPTELNDHNGGGFLAIFSSRGELAKCAHTFPEWFSPDGECGDVNPAWNTAQLPAGETLEIRIQRHARDLAPGVYAARFNYDGGGGLGRPATCPSLTESGYVIGPVGGPAIQFVLW